MDRSIAFEFLKKYNKDNFHIRHALTVEYVMRWFAKQNNEDENFWGIVGLLHDIDFELYPQFHCLKAPELLKEINCSQELIHAVCSHGYGICCDVKPNCIMEKILFAVDELTGLIWASAKMRPSQSTKDMDLKSVKKKFKDKKFAAGCSRDVILTGATQLGWDIDELIEKTLYAMQQSEDDISKDYELFLRSKE